jgi:hypothetical protein
MYCIIGAGMYFNNRIHMDIPRCTKDSLTTKDKKSGMNKSMGLSTSLA